ncbi:MAG TPA: tetratricopeptide repeat protein [Opitutaceae bacterium]
MPPDPTPVVEALNAILERADKYFASKDWKMVRELLGVAVSLSPGDVMLLSALGGVEYEQKNYPAALAHFTSAEQVNADDPELQIKLGMTYLAMNRFIEAFAALRKAIALRPGDPTATKLLKDADTQRMRWIGEEYARCEKSFEHTPLQAVDKGLATIGRWSYGYENIKWWGSKSRLKIGSFCSIAEGVTFVLGGEHFTNRISTYEFTGGWFREAYGVDAAIGPPDFSRGDITVGSDVWLGTRVTVMSGVTIGHGAIVGAGAIVTKDIPPYTVAVGIPAKVLRKRFSDEQTAQLLEASWWDLPDEEIAKLCPLLYGSDIDALIAAVRQAKAAVGSPTRSKDS